MSFRAPATLVNVTFAALCVSPFTLTSCSGSGGANDSVSDIPPFGGQPSATQNTVNASQSGMANNGSTQQATQPNTQQAMNQAEQNPAATFTETSTAASNSEAGAMATETMFVDTTNGAQDSVNPQASNSPQDNTPQGDGNTEPQVPTPNTSATAPAVGAEFCPAGPFAMPQLSNAELVASRPPGSNGFSIWEGPVWTGTSLFFSQIEGGASPPPASIHRFTPGQGVAFNVFANSGSNGLALAPNGDLLAATHDTGAISNFVVGGNRNPVGEQTFEGNRFNSPNDLVARTDGNIYFTDPNFQAPGNPQNATRVYRIDPQGQVTIVDQMDRPNGITMSPDGTHLYVSSNQFDRALVEYPLDADGAAGEGTTFNVSLNTPDGMAMDCAGNIYTTEHNARTIRVVSPAGQQLLELTADLAGNLTNLAFGGANRQTLFLTTTTQDSGGGLYAIETNLPGLPN